MPTDLETHPGPVEFDPFSDEYFNDPTATYARLRDEAPVYFNEHYGFYALSRFDDVASASLDWGTYSSEYGIDLATLRRRKHLGMDMIIMMDPPKHDRMRALVSRVFTPRAIGALEPMIREVITGYADQVDATAGFDAVADFSAPFPVEIISRMLGVPEGDRQQIRHWLDVSLHREHGNPEPTHEGVTAMLNSVAYFQELIAEKRTNPDDDMLSRLTQVEVDRGDGSMTGLTDDEIAGFATLLGGAGAETVTKLVGNAAVLFARHPDQWNKVLADRALIAPAVEEVLRYHPPSQYQGRFTVQESERHGVTIPAGYPIILITGAATRDDRHYDEPDRFEIERPASLSLGFGYGIHSCVGAALARMESRIAFELMAERWPRFEIDESGLRRVNMSNVAGYSSVPLSVA
ncbi:MAG: cytochrome P450 [Acidimicrobiales bacterium]